MHRQWHIPLQGYPTPTTLSEAIDYIPRATQSFSTNVVVRPQTFLTAIHQTCVAQDT